MQIETTISTLYNVKKCLEEEINIVKSLKQHDEILEKIKQIEVKITQAINKL